MRNSLDIASRNEETLIDVLRQRALAGSSQEAYTFLLDGESEKATLSLGQLDAQARAIAVLLKSVAATDARVLLLYPAGLDFISAFVGCLYARAVAVPVPLRVNRKLDRLATVAADSGASLVLTTRAILSKFDALSANVPGLRSLLWLATDDIEISQAETWERPSVSRNTLAFLQYTSGSTTAPRGVMVTHENLLRNERLIQEAFKQTEESVILSWLPLYHDMGLIGGVLQPLYLGAKCILMSPLAFLQRPRRWLQAISQYRVTTSGGPDFAYDLCARKASGQDGAGLDLSSWTVAFNGSEPVRAETLDRFTEAFAPYGFKRESFFPCYGLAEATLLVSGGGNASQPLVKAVQAEALKRHRIVAAHDGEPEARSLVASGRVGADHQVVIVDPQSSVPCPQGDVGEIWVSGACVAQGYYNRTEETRRTFEAYLAGDGRGPFLRTGDLGFIADGELFVTGRRKDLLIIRGQNYYPQDVEATVQRCSKALRQGCGAAFPLEVSGRERLVIVQEVEPRCPQNLDQLTERIRQSVAEEHELAAYAIVLIKAGSIPRTSSSKVRRQACRAEFLEDKFDVLCQWREPAAQADQDAEPLGEALHDNVEAVEKWLVAALAAKLGLEADLIDPGQPLARYGLDSLAAIEFIHKLETSLGVCLPMTAFLEASSLRELASIVFNRVDQSSGEAAPVPHAGKSLTEYRLARAQMALYFLHQLTPDVAVCNIAALGAIAKPLDVAALRRAFQHLLRRHPSLRANFIQTSEGPVQRINQEQDLCFTEVDAASTPPEDLTAAIIEQANRRFNLEEEPLLRLTLYKRPQDVLLLMVVHHMVIDFWSLGLLIKELGAVYSAETSGTRAPLPLPAAAFSDYVRWQEDMLAGADGERLWEYWKRKLDGELPALDLPTDRPRPPVQSHTGDSQGFNLSSETTAALAHLSQSRQATLFALLAAAFAAFLHRYTGQNDVLVGALSSGRSLARFADVVGYFVNPIVLRGQFFDTDTFQSFLSQMRATVLEALDHQDYPFALLVEKLQRARDPSRSPLVQAMFIYQKAHLANQQALTRFALGEPGARLRVGEIEIESLELPQRTTQFDLTLKMGAFDERMMGSLEYSTELFDASTIARMLDHFQVLVEGMLRHPHRPLSDLPIMREAERRLLLYEWNLHSHSHARDDVFIHAQFASQARHTPDAIAVTCEQEQISYGTLNRSANRLAHHLRRLGVRPEARVAICMRRSADLIIGLLGILKSGGAYVPLDPAFPADRLALLLADSGVCAMISERQMIASLPPSAATLVSVDADREPIAQNSSADPVCGLDYDNLAYVIYTSGSTGKPKGVMVSHRNLSSFGEAMDEQFGRREAGCWLAVTSISFDISVLELLWTLSRGFRLIIHSEGDGVETLADHSISSEICRHGVTHLQCTPSLARSLTYELDSRQALQGLAEFLVGGEALPLHLAQELGQVVSGNLRNMYGPTETTIWSAVDLVPQSAERITIGRPLPNGELYILDRRLQPTPIAVAGSLHIGGEAVARGYLNLPDLSAERFLPDPFSNHPGSRFYATGDVSRYLPDGRVEFLGRDDQQVKIRGHRIEPAEIEAALEAHDDVLQAAVVPQAGPQGDKRLVAYLMLKSAQAFEPSQMKRYLRARLPEYMIPSALVRLDAMPLTLNGKIYRKGLSAAAPCPINAERKLDLPRNPLEEVVAGIWASLLELEEVGIHDDFFEIGGHSILATQLISRLRETFQVELPLRAFLTVPTVAGLTAIIADDPQQEGRARRVAELLLTIASYSDEEAEAMLGESHP